MRATAAAVGPLCVFLLIAACGGKHAPDHDRGGGDGAPGDGAGGDGATGGDGGDGGPATPRNLFAQLNGSAVALSWSGVAGADRYLVYRDASASGGPTILTEVQHAASDPQTYEDASPPMGATSYYRVASIVSGAVSPPSDPAAVSVGTQLPAVTGLTAVALDRYTVRVGWTVTASAAQYRVYRGQGSIGGTYYDIVAPPADLPVPTPGVWDFWIAPLTASNFEGPRAGPVSADTRGAPLPALTLMAQEHTEPRSIQLTWSAPPGATATLVERDDTASFTAPLELASNLVTAYDYDYDHGATYYYRVAYTDGTATSPWSVIAVPTRPGAPTDLVVTSFSVGHIELGWAAALGATRYSVYRHQAGGSRELVQAGVEALLYRDSSVAAHTEYTYYIVAVNDVGEGDEASIGAASEPDVTATPPTNVVATDGDYDRVVVTWDGAQGAVRYRVTRTVSSVTTSLGSVDAPLLTLTDASPPFSTSTAGTVATYRVHASVSDGGAGFVESDASVSDTGYAIRVASPTGVDASTDLNGRIRVTWDASTDAVSYNVYRSAVSPTAFALLDSTFDLTLDDDTVTPQTNYRYLVRAVSVNGGESAAPNEDTGYSPCAIPAAQNVVASRSVAFAVELSWDTVPGAVSYKVKRGTSSSGTYTQVGTDLGAAATTFTDDGNALALDGLYGTRLWYRVEPYSVAGYPGCAASPVYGVAVAFAADATRAFTTPVNSPWGVATDAAGSVYTLSNDATPPTDTGVFKINPATGLATALAGSFGAADDQFNGASGLTVSADGLTLYVTDLHGDGSGTNRDCVHVFVNGTQTLKFGARGSGDGQFIWPRDVAVDSGSNIYVVDSGNARIQKFNAAGVFQRKWGSSGIGDGQFVTPNSLAIDSDDYVYVVDEADTRVQKFDAAGAFVTSWSPDSIASSFAIAYSAVSDSLFVAVNGLDEVHEFDRDGTFVAKVGDLGTSEFDSIRDIAAHEDWGFWVHESVGGVLKFRKYLLAQ